MKSEKEVFDFTIFIGRLINNRLNLHIYPSDLGWSVQNIKTLYSLSRKHGLNRFGRYEDLGKCDGIQVRHLQNYFLRSLFANLRSYSSCS